MSSEKTLTCIYITLRIDMNYYSFFNDSSSSSYATDNNNSIWNLSNVSWVSWDLFYHYLQLMRIKILYFFLIDLIL